jgi:phenylacetate-CoA ligase
LKEIQGRSTDFVVAADGTVMHGLALIYILRDQPGVKEFKVIQESTELTRVLIVTEPPFKPEIVNIIVTGFKQRLGETVEIDVQSYGQYSWRKNPESFATSSATLPKSAKKE